MTYGESSSKYKSPCDPPAALPNRDKEPWAARACGMGLPRPLCAARIGAAREALPPAAPGARTPNWWFGALMTEAEAERVKGATSQAPAEPYASPPQLRRRRAPVPLRVERCKGGADSARESVDGRAI